MRVIPINRVVDKKRIIGKRRPEEEERPASPDEFVLDQNFQNQYIFYTKETSSTKNVGFFCIFFKENLNNCPLGENSPNLITPHSPPHKEEKFLRLFVSRRRC
jgi:hypothetical protein